MTDAEISSFLLAEQLADKEGYVDLRNHPLNASVVSILRRIAEIEKEFLWFPYNYRIQFYAKGRDRARQIRLQQHAINAARQYRFDDRERSILVLFSRQSTTTGLKALPHVEISATGFPPEAIEAAYRSLQDKGLTHANSKALVLEPKGTSVADGVYLLMLHERYSDAELPSSEPNDKPEEKAILSPFEKAIFPWFASLGSRWQPAPEEMTDAEEKAMYRLIGGGFIEAKVEVVLTPMNGATPTGGVWRVSGPFPDAFERQIIEFGQARGLEEKQVRLNRRIKSLRLTSEGERAKADFHGEHEFQKPPGSTTGIPKHLFDIISGGHDGSRG